MKRHGLAALLCAAASALAQPQAQPQAQAPCPAPQDVNRTHLFGQWRAEFEGLWQDAILEITPHREYALSFSGTIDRAGVRGLIAGDIEVGELTLEESADGKRIAATFLGDVVDGSCGREIRGTWQAEGDPAARGFVMRKR